MTIGDYVVAVSIFIAIVAAPFLIRYGINHYFIRKRQFLDGLGMTKEN